MYIKREWIRALTAKKKINRLDANEVCYVVIRRMINILMVGILETLFFIF